MMRIYEAPVAQVIELEVVNVIATSEQEDTPETLELWGGLVQDVNGGFQGETPI